MAPVSTGLTSQQRRRERVWAHFYSYCTSMYGAGDEAMFCWRTKEGNVLLKNDYNPEGLYIINLLHFKVPNRRWSNVLLKNVSCIYLNLRTAFNKTHWQQTKIKQQWPWRVFCRSALYSCFFSWMLLNKHLSCLKIKKSRCNSCEFGFNFSMWIFCYTVKCADFGQEREQNFYWIIWAFTEWNLGVRAVLMSNTRQKF